MRLQTLDNFNNGEVNNYAFGVTIGEFNGAKRISHGGSIGGFRSFICSFPEQKLDIAVLTNYSFSSVGSKSDAITEIILGEKEEEEVISSRKKVKTIKVSEETLKSYEGFFWNDANNYVRRIYLKDDTLRYYRGPGNESPIVPINKDEFQMLEVEVDLKIKFETQDNQRTMEVTIDDGIPIHMEGFESVTPTKEILASYTGSYFSPELQTIYLISLEDEKLVCHHTRHGELRMKFIKENVIEGQWPFNIAKFKRDESGEIQGLYVSNGRVRNLWFEKKE